MPELSLRTLGQGSPGGRLGAKGIACLSKPGLASPSHSSPTSVSAGTELMHGAQWLVTDGSEGWYGSPAVVASVGGGRRTLGGM